MGIIKKLTKQKDGETPVENTASSSVDTTSPAQTEKKSTSFFMDGVILHPIVSEKATHAETMGTYTFKVDPKATKISIKKAIQSLYHVTPTSVRVMHMQGKAVRFGRFLGKRKDWKKAIVTLPKGSTIDIHEGV